jgi:hypothetical protein
MTLKLRQEEIMQELIANVQAKFPEMKYLDYHGDPYGGSQVIIEVALPDEETMFAMSEYAAGLEIDILVKYGYSFMLMPNYPHETADVA